MCKVHALGFLCNTASVIIIQIEVGILVLTFSNMLKPHFAERRRMTKKAMHKSEFDWYYSCYCNFPHSLR